MSFSAAQAKSFLGPLKGRTAAFMVGDRRTCILLLRVLVPLAALVPGGCAVFDVDALLASSFDQVAPLIPRDVADSVKVWIPEPDKAIEGEFARFLAAEASVFVVAGTNSMYQLFSSPEAGSRNRKIALALTLLSYLSRASGAAGILVIYRREKVARAARGGSISDLADATVSVLVEGTELVMRCERGTAWVGGRFSLRIP